MSNLVIVYKDGIYKRIIILEILCMFFFLSFFLKLPFMTMIP